MLVYQRVTYLTVDPKGCSHLKPSEFHHPMGPWAHGPRQNNKRRCHALATLMVRIQKVIHLLVVDLTIDANRPKWLTTSMTTTTMTTTSRPGLSWDLWYLCKIVQHEYNEYTCFIRASLWRLSHWPALQQLQRHRHLPHLGKSSETSEFCWINGTCTNYR